MRRKRVFKDVLGPWPQVFRKGEEFEIIAKHRGPGGEHWGNLLALLTGVGVAFFIANEYLTMENWFWASWGAVMAGMFSNLFLQRVFGLMPFFTSITRLRFNGGRIEWRGPRGWETVQAGEPRNLRYDMHRAGPREGRRTLQRNKGKEEFRVYQNSSEVFIDTGPKWMHGHLVAEIADDETREKAHRLAAAIEFVDEQARALAGRKREYRGAGVGSELD